MKKIKETMELSLKEKEASDQLNQKIMKDNQMIQEKEKIIDQKLGKVQPMIEEAKKAVSNIKKQDLAEIISMLKPPDPVRHVLQGVLIILGETELDWSNCIKFLRGGVTKLIMSFDAKTMITKAIASKTKKHFTYHISLLTYHLLIYYRRFIVISK